MTTCPHCTTEFSPRRADQVYCSPKCRMDHYKATLGDGGLRGTITAVRRLKGGGSIGHDSHAAGIGAERVTADSRSECGGGGVTGVQDRAHCVTWGE